MGRFVLVCIAAAIALTSWAGGYLRVIGPKPVRLQPVPTAPAAKAVALPPLPTVETNSVPSEPGSVPEAPASDERPPEPLLSITTGESVTNFVSSILGPLTATPEQQLLTPQMLIPYFREMDGGTNTSKFVVAPVTFVPPVPSPRSTSKSTYNMLPPPGPQR